MFLGLVYFGWGSGSVVLGASVIFLFPKVRHLKLFNVYTVIGVIASALAPSSTAKLA